MNDQTTYWRGQAAIRQEIIQSQRRKIWKLERQVQNLTASLVALEDQLGDQL